MLSSILSNILHLFFALTIILIIIFSKKISVLIYILLGIFGMIFLNYKCLDCPISQLEDNYHNNSVADYIGSFFLGEKYNKTDRRIFTLIILFIGFFLTCTRIIGILLFKFFSKDCNF
jgi:hypothetical protein